MCHDHRVSTYWWSPIRLRGCVTLTALGSMADGRRPGQGGTSSVDRTICRRLLTMPRICGSVGPLVATDERTPNYDRIATVANVDRDVLKQLEFHGLYAFIHHSVDVGTWSVGECLDIRLLDDQAAG